MFLIKFCYFTIFATLVLGYAEDLVIIIVVNVNFILFELRSIYLLAIFCGSNHYMELLPIIMKKMGLNTIHAKT